MQLTEQQVIDKQDPRYTIIDEVAFTSKTLYHAGTDAQTRRGSDYFQKKVSSRR